MDGFHTSNNDSYWYRFIHSFRYEIFLQRFTFFSIIDCLGFIDAGGVRKVFETANAGGRIQFMEYVSS